MVVAGACSAMNSMLASNSACTAAPTLAHISASARPAAAAGCIAPGSPPGTSRLRSLARLLSATMAALARRLE